MYNDRMYSVDYYPEISGYDSDDICKEDIRKQASSFEMADDSRRSS
ncbi:MULTISPECIES: hypothetical protein [Clostridium]|nr:MULTISPECIES: hypothetical protein [Clostridium]EKQ57655.1 MAG: hypothetical protein A370_00641 [Clostridium sp. Maddingley MBC34-26]